MENENNVEIKKAEPMKEENEVKEYLDSFKIFIEDMRKKKNIKLEKDPYVYKYIPFINKEKMDERLNSIKNDECWLSRINKLNDPFENQMAYYSVEKLKKAKWPDEEIHKYKSLINMVKNSLFIASFTRKNNNFPMWYSYANNYNGCCLKYKIINKDSFWEVQYDEKRVGITRFFSFLQYDDYRSTVGSYINMFSIYKNIDWSYEEEIRFVHPKVDFYMSDEKKGLLMKNNDIGVELEEIYIGCNCDKETCEKIINYSKDKNIKIFKMLGVDSIKYQFEYEEL